MPRCKILTFLVMATLALRLDAEPSNFCKRAQEGWNNFSEAQLHYLFNNGGMFRLREECSIYHGNQVTDLLGRLINLYKKSADKDLILYADHFNNYLDGEHGADPYAYFSALMTDAPELFVDALLLTDIAKEGLSSDEMSSMGLQSVDYTDEGEIESPACELAVSLRNQYATLLKSYKHNTERYLAAYTVFANYGFYISYYKDCAEQAKKMALENIPPLQVGIVDDIFKKAKWLKRQLAHHEKHCYLRGLQASSTLSDSGNLNYRVTNLLDNRLNTAWVKGSKNDAVGQTITIHHPKDCAKKFSRLGIYNGYQKSHKIWKNNSRIKQLQLTLISSDKYTKNMDYFISLSDKQGLAIIDIPLENWKSIVLRVQSSYSGEKFDDLAVSELLFFN